MLEDKEQSGIKVLSVKHEQVRWVSGSRISSLQASATNDTCTSIGISTEPTWSLLNTLVGVDPMIHEPTYRILNKLRSSHVQS